MLDEQIQNLGTLAKIDWASGTWPIVLPMLSRHHRELSSCISQLHMILLRKRRWCNPFYSWNITICLPFRTTAFLLLLWSCISTASYAAFRACRYGYHLRVCPGVRLLVVKVNLQVRLSELILDAKLIIIVDNFRSDFGEQQLLNKLRNIKRAWILCVFLITCKVFDRLIAWL